MLAHLVDVLGFLVGTMLAVVAAAALVMAATALIHPAAGVVVGFVEVWLLVAWLTWD